MPRAEMAAPSLADLLDLDDAGFRKIFAGSPIKRIGRNRMVRNAAIAAGNSGRRELAPRLERLLEDPDPIVADAASWALRRLDPAKGPDQRRASRAATQEERSISRPSGSLASTWVATGSPPPRPG